MLEVIISIAIFTAATLMVAAYIIQGYRANRFAMQQSDAIDYARRGITSMTKEIREADFSDLGSYPIASATNQSLIFYSNVDTDDAVEKVRYYLENTNFKKGVTKPSGNPLSYASGTEVTSVIAQYVRNGADPLFYYYPGDYPSSTAPLATPANPNQVKLVELRLRVNIDPALAPEEFILKNFIQVRNLKDNL